MIQLQDQLGRLKLGQLGKPTG